MNKHKALRQLARDTPDRVTVKILRDQMYDDHWLFRKYVAPWLKLLKMKYGRPVRIAAQIEDYRDPTGYSILTVFVDEEKPLDNPPTTPTRRC